MNNGRVVPTPQAVGRRATARALLAWLSAWRFRARAARTPGRPGVALRELVRRSPCSCGSAPMPPGGRRCSPSRRCTCRQKLSRSRTVVETRAVVKRLHEHLAVGDPRGRFLEGFSAAYTIRTSKYSTWRRG